MGSNNPKGYRRLGLLLSSYGEIWKCDDGFFETCRLESGVVGDTVRRGGWSGRWQALALEMDIEIKHSKCVGLGFKPGLTLLTGVQESNLYWSTRKSLGLSFCSGQLFDSSSCY